MVPTGDWSSQSLWPWGAIAFTILTLIGVVLRRLPRVSFGGASEKRHSALDRPRRHVGSPGWSPHRTGMPRTRRALFGSAPVLPAQAASRPNLPRCSPAVARPMQY